jgi:hypothetical protein
MDRVKPTIRLGIAFYFALAAQSAVPTPESHFGHSLTADRQPLEWAKVVSYYEKLAAASDRLKLEKLGPTTEGRPFLMAIISSPQNLRNLNRYREIQGALADPRKTPPDAAAKLIAEGKTVVAITNSIHASEVASTFTGMQFAFNILTSDKPRFKTILDNTIFILVPSLNPDGVDIIGNWARKTMGTPHEGTIPPELYQKYVGHDNNRDWYIFSQAETRLAIEKMHNAWHPQIVYDVHQMGPTAGRMFVPPWMDPIDPNIDPAIAQACNSFGMGIAYDLTSAGRKGVVVNAMYDFWTPARHYQSYHGGLRILTESASARLFSPVNIKPEQLRGQALGYNVGERAWNHLEPWTGGDWSLKEIITDQLIAYESVLWQASVRREDLLSNFYKIHQRAVARPAGPYAFVVNGDQADPGSTRKLLETLAFGQVEIEQATAKFTADGREYPAGSYVIRLQQPYSAFAKTLMERQQYPDLRLYPGGPPKRPYDVTAQTLPLLMGVAADTIQDRFSAPLVRTTNFTPRQQGTLKPGAWAGSDNDSWKKVNGVWKSGKSVWRDPATGDFFTTAGAGLVEKKKPRIALYRSWMSSMDEGWTRWILEQFAFDYARLTNPQILAGGLRAKYDVIVFPDQSPASIANGYRAGAMPEEFTGGLGKAGADALKAFAQEGGTLVFLNDSTEYAVEALGLGASNVLKGVSNRDFYSPGSLLNVTLDNQHPIGLGLPKALTIWSEGSPAWALPGGEKSVANYNGRDLLASGWLLGEKFLVNRSALVDAPLGKGHVVLFGMRPQYRATSYQTFKLFFNAFLL